MIVQITRTKNELFLIKELLPIWQRYADGFVFYDDHSTDGTFEYLNENREKYNILEIIRNEIEDNYTQKLKIESNYIGVHEFKPHVRGECYTKKFEGTHPESIINSYELLNQRFKKELQNYVDDPK